MKIISVVGTRPEFIQAAPVSWALREDHQEVLVHTGQHYDPPLSEAFFRELDIPAPNYNLAVGSGSHNQQTGRIMIRLEEVLREERADLILVHGDTNSTLGGALAASKLGIAVAHIEAGERSFNRRMPEEINRLVADRLANIHFCASQNALDHLAAEGITDSAYWVGDVMLDAITYYRPIARRRSKILSHLGLEPAGYCLVTVHRASNTDDPRRLDRIVRNLNRVDEKIVFPIHPRTSRAVSSLGIQFGDHVQIIEPVGYLDMIQLEENARLIATDSGGVQREAYFLGVPCLTLRDETEWVETVETGWNKVVGADEDQTLTEWESFSPPDEHPAILGDGKASERIARILGGETVADGFLPAAFAQATKASHGQAIL